MPRCGNTTKEAAMLRTVLQRLRPPRLGVIHLGISTERTREDGTTYDQPSEVPYFVLPDDLAEAVLEASKKTDRPLTDRTQINRLRVLLPSSEIDAVIPQS